MNTENSTTINLTVSSSLSHQCENGIKTENSANINLTVNNSLPYPCENGNETENPVGSISPTTSKSVLIPLGNGKKLEIITGQIINSISADSDWNHDTWQTKISTQLTKVEQITGSASLASIDVVDTECVIAIDSTSANWLADENTIQLTLNLVVGNATINRVDFQVFAYGE